MLNVNEKIEIQDLNLGDEDRDLCLNLDIMIEMIVSTPPISIRR